MLRRSLVLCLAMALCACIGGERVTLNAKSPPPPPKALPRTPVALSVADEREEVKRGDVEAWHLGEAPGGDRKELSNHQLVPLAAQIRADLTDELESLGFEIFHEPDVRRLEVEVRDWRFDADTRRLRYRIGLKVLERDEGATFAQSMLEDEVAVAGADEDSTKAELKRDYALIIRKLLRDNATILAALKR